MRIHCFQHVPFEGPAAFECWARGKGYSFKTTKFYEGETAPQLESLDWLIIMGGPMNIYEEEIYPWLVEEKRFIHHAISLGKTVIGVCLGAQLISDILGGRVIQGAYKEIGWFPITLSAEAMQSDVFGFLPNKITVLHWHGDTFYLPPGAIHLAKSEGCENQAFFYKNRVLGLQFHLETTQESLEQIAQNSKNDLIDGRYIQSEQEILSAGQHIQEINDALFGILDRLAAS